MGTPYLRRTARSSWSQFQGHDAVMPSGVELAKRAVEQSVEADEGELRCAHRVTPHPFDGAPCRSARSSLMSLRSLTQCWADPSAWPWSEADGPDFGR